MTLQSYLNILSNVGPIFPYYISIFVPISEIKNYYLNKWLLKFEGFNVIINKVLIVFEIFQVSSLFLSGLRILLSLSYAVYISYSPGIIMQVYIFSCEKSATLLAWKNFIICYKLSYLGFFFYLVSSFLLPTATVILFSGLLWRRNLAAPLKSDKRLINSKFHPFSRQLQKCVLKSHRYIKLESWIS